MSSTLRKSACLISFGLSVMSERRTTRMGRPNGSCTVGGRHWRKEEGAAKSSRGRSLARQHRVDLRASKAKDVVNLCLYADGTGVRIKMLF